MNVYENIVLPVELDGDTADQRFMDNIVNMLGLDDKLNICRTNFPAASSSVLLLLAPLFQNRLLYWPMNRPEISTAKQARGFGLLKRTSEEFHQTIVMITHNNDIARLADRIVRIEDGKITEG